MHAARPQSWGTVTYPLALIPALAATWSMSPERIPALQVAFAVLAVADPLASWVGERVKSPVWMGTGSRKTVAGSTAFALAAGGLTLGVLEVTTLWGMGRIAGVAGCVAVVGAAVEALGRKGWDNFFVVQAVVLVVVAAGEGTVASLTGSVIAGIVFAVFARGSGTLNARGAVAGGLLAASLVGLGGWAWAVPGFAFFVLSSALSRIGSAAKSEAEVQPEKGSVRDLGQVLANGGVAWTCLLVAAVLPESGGENGTALYSALYAAFTGAFAAAAADTWATEIGTLSSRRPVSVTTFRPVARGTSGAVSLTGTLGAVAGAASVAGAAVAAGGASLPTAPLPAMMLLTAAGTAGMLADSLAGATIQARYRDPATGALTERRPEPSAPPVAGWAGIDNDAVNWIATTTGALTALAGL
jgi:uncharacterized protein (TIGR00297 family)